MKKIIIVLLALTMGFSSTIKMDSSEVAEVIKNPAMAQTSYQGGNGFIDIDMINEIIPATSNEVLRFNNVPRDYTLYGSISGTSLYQSTITTPSWIAGTAITTASISYKYGANDNLEFSSEVYTFGTEITDFPTHYFTITIYNNHASENVRLTGNIRLSQAISTKNVLLDGQPIDVSTQGFEITLGTNTAVTASIASTQLLAANADRKYAAFINDGTAVTYLKIGAAAVLSEGIRLNAGGGSFEITADNLLMGAVYGISTTSSNICVIEGE